jgi:hypothetical protein
MLDKPEYIWAIVITILLLVLISYAIYSHYKNKNDSGGNDKKYDYPSFEINTLNRAGLHGATFSNITQSQLTSQKYITYSIDKDNGDYCTILKKGIYSLTFIFFNQNLASGYISKNSQNITDLTKITAGNLLTVVSGLYPLTVTWTGLLVPNDIITPKSSGLTFLANYAQGSFRIVCLGLVD